jgi:hypothetical protein
MNVAQTILQQIKSIDPWAMAAWGAKDLVNMGAGLKFKTSGMVKWKGYVHVKYDAGNDVYDVDFYRIRGAKIIVDNAIQGVYCDMLVDVVNGQVG